MIRTPIFFLGLSRGSLPGLKFVNFKLDMFSFLNITSLGSDLVDDQMDCGFTCLEIPLCFSYNVAAFSDINGKLLCELLPSDKFNNSDNFTSSPFYHHFSSIPVSQELIVFLINNMHSVKRKLFKLKVNRNLLQNYELRKRLLECREDVHSLND